eukprot:scaffold14843_cov70-Phaeocystis_antarctica.AAC.1
MNEPGVALAGLQVDARASLQQLPHDLQLAVCYGGVQQAEAHLARPTLGFRWAARRGRSCGCSHRCWPWLAAGRACTPASWLRPKYEERGEKETAQDSRGQPLRCARLERAATVSP